MSLDPFARFCLDGRVALVTGAARGIGPAAAVLYLASDAAMVSGHVPAVDGGWLAQ